MPAVQARNNQRTFALTVGGVPYLRKVDAPTIKWTETGTNSVAVCEFVVELSSFNDHLTYGFPHKVILLDSTNNRRLFGGNLVNTRRYHLAGAGVGIACTAVSFDAWLDRRNLPRWQSKENVGATSRKISSDQKIVQRIINDSMGGGNIDLVANDTYVDETNADMQVLDFEDGTAREMISFVGEYAASIADPTARRCYVDFYGNVHYFSGSEGTAPQYRIGDARYTSVVKATSGLVSLWALREASAAPAYDAQSFSHMALSGNYSRNQTGGVPNEPQMRATLFNGTNSFGAADGSGFPANTFSIELWFKRNAFGTSSTMVSGGTDSWEVGWTAANEIAVRKEGTGDNFVTTATYTDTDWHHLVVTREPGTTIVYVDGVSKAGTVTARTFSAPPANINIARRLSATDRYYIGYLQNVAVYSTTMSAANALAHFRAGRTLVPEYIDAERDLNDAGFSVYVRGKPGTGGTGWAIAPYQSRYAQNFIIDVPESDTVAKRNAVAAAFLARDGADVVGGTFTVTGFDGWRAGQTVSIVDSGLGINSAYEIRQIEARINSNGVATYDISYGMMPWSGTFDIQRKRRRRRR